MFYGVYELYGAKHSAFYDEFGDEWFRDTFCPDTKVLIMIDLKSHGKTYEERKESVRDVAYNFQDLFSVYGVDLSYEELSIFEDFFTRYGKHYGLLKEFKGNGIC